MTRPIRPLGSTDLHVTDLCVGTGELGDMTKVYGYTVDDERAAATLAAVLDGPFNLIDTSNGYGHGRSEERIGRALKVAGGVPDGMIIATKVDPAPGGVFDGPRVRASVTESCERLGLDHLPLVHLHDPERIGFEDATRPGGPWPVLLDLQAEGLVGRIGVAGGPIDLMRRFVATGQAAAVLTHNRFTLLDRSADPLLQDCADAGVGVINGAPFGGGMLARGPRREPRYCYRPASEGLIRSALAIEEACADAGVPLAAAALQFSLRDPRITSTVVGLTRPERLQQALDLAEQPIPESLWDTLQELVPPPDTWLA